MGPLALPPISLAGPRRKQGYGKLLQLYGVHKATVEAKKKGLSVLRWHQPNGSIKLVLVGVS